MSLPFWPQIYIERAVDFDPEVHLPTPRKGLILDLDNTLVPWGTEDVSPEVELWVASMRERGIKMMILSNSTSGRVMRLGKRFDMPHISGAGKPFGPGYEAALRRLDLPREAVAAIGDQLFTDTLGANRAGISSVLVKPLAKRDFIGTIIISRNLERFFIKRIIEERGVK